MLDADQFDEDDWGWSSSELNSWGAWNVDFGDGSFNYTSKSSSCVVRAVSAFSPLQRGDFSSPSENGNCSPFTEESAIEYLRQLGYTGELTKKINV